jgi:hypothetical protein
MPLSSADTKGESSGVSMDVLSLLKLLFRHWRVTAPAAVLTLLGLVTALQLSSPTYEATGSIVLLPSPEPPDANGLPESAPAPDVGQNPFARYGDLAVVSDILARVMDSDSKRDEFESQGVTGYDVVANRLQRGPVVEVTGEGPSPEAAIRSAETVLAEVDAVLLELQAAEGADPDYFINSAPLDPPSTATAMYGSAVRAAIAALAVGALGTLGLAVLAEALARRQTVRPATAADPLTSDTAGLGKEAGASNGSPKADSAARRPTILPALPWAQRQPLEQEPERQMEQLEPLQLEPSQLDSARQRTPERRPPKLESSADTPSSEHPADNGHRPPTTDRST